MCFVGYQIPHTSRKFLVRAVQAQLGRPIPQGSAQLARLGPQWESWGWGRWAARRTEGRAAGSVLGQDRTEVHVLSTDPSQSQLLF